VSSLAQIHAQGLCEKRSITHNKSRLISRAYHGGVPLFDNPDSEFDDGTVGTILSRNKELSILLLSMVAYALRILSVLIPNH